MRRLAQGLDRVQPILILVGRAVSGALLAVTLSVIGIATAWGVFVFSGAASHTIMLVMFMTGAGLGGGLGSLLAWTKIDGMPSRRMFLTAMLIVVVAGITGAWGGFRFGATQEVECCVGPSIEPITYMVGGTTLLANTAALVWAITYDIKARRRWVEKFRPARARSAAGTTSESGRLPN